MQEGTLAYTESKLRPHLANCLHKCACGSCDNKMLVLVDDGQLLSKKYKNWAVSYDTYVEEFHRLKTSSACPHERFSKVWDWLKICDLDSSYENMSENEKAKRRWQNCEEAICHFYILRMAVFGTRVPMLVAS